MENVIVAGIINTRTGEIVETTNNPSAKTRLNLRARDELNAEHGKGTFMVFEFNSMGGMGNLDYVRRNMRTDDAAALANLELLRARYKVAETIRSIERVTAEMTKLQEVRDECMALYERQGDGQKRTIVDGAFSHDIEVFQEEIGSLNSQLAQHRKRLRTFSDTD